MEKLLEKMKNGMNKKTGHSLAHLMDNRDEDLENKKKIGNILKKLIQK